MSTARHLRGLGSINLFAGGSRTARPPQRLQTYDIKPHRCDMTLDFPRILVKMPDPDPVPEGNVLDLSWAGDEGDYLAVVMAASPWLAVYTRNGDVLEDRLTIGTAPTWQPGTCDWTPDAQYLAIQGATGADQIAWWQRSGTSLTRLTDTTGGINNQPVRWMRWDPSGIYLAVLRSGSSGGKVVSVFKRSGSTLSYLTEVGLGSNSMNIQLEWAPDGLHIVGVYSSGIPWAIKRSGDTFSSITAPPDLPGNDLGGITWGPGPVVYFASTDTAPAPDVSYITAHTLSGDTFGAAVNYSVNADFGKIAMHPSGSAIAAWDDDGNAIDIIEAAGTSLTDAGTDYPANVPNDFSLRWTRSGVYLAVGNSVGGTGDSTAAVDWWKARC